MIYNVVLKSKNTNEIVSTVKGYDSRPLRFTEYKYAEALAQDKNATVTEKSNMAYVVIEEKNNLCDCKEKKCLSYY